MSENSDSQTENKALPKNKVVPFLRYVHALQESECVCPSNSLSANAEDSQEREVSNKISTLMGKRQMNVFSKHFFRIVEGEKQSRKEHFSFNSREDGNEE